MARLPEDQRGSQFTQQGGVDDGFPLIGPQALEVHPGIERYRKWGLPPFPLFPHHLIPLESYSTDIHSKLLAKYGHPSGDLLPEDSKSEDAHVPYIKI